MKYDLVINKRTAKKPGRGVSKVRVLPHFQVSVPNPRQLGIIHQSSYKERQ